MSNARDLSDLRFPVTVDKGGTGNNGTLTAMASNVNWDTLTSPGKYFVPSASGSNVPQSGNLNWVVNVVNTANGLKQTATVYGNTITYSRAVVSGSWAAWYKSYDQTNIVGSVSQNSGVPTGAIIERGTNAYGDFVKYADGTLICSSANSPQATSTIAANNVGTALTITMPATFINTAYTVSASAGPNSSNDHFGVTNSSPLTGNTVSVILRNGATAQTFLIKFIAIGRWY